MRKKERRDKVSYVTVDPVAVEDKLELLVPYLIVGAEPRPKGYTVLS